MARCLYDTEIFLSNRQDISFFQKTVDGASVSSGVPPVHEDARTESFPQLLACAGMIFMIMRGEDSFYLKAPSDGDVGDFSGFISRIDDICFASVAVVQNIAVIFQFSEYFAYDFHVFSVLLFV